MDLDAADEGNKELTTRKLLRWVEEFHTTLPTTKRSSRTIASVIVREAGSALVSLNQQSTMFVAKRFAKRQQMRLSPLRCPFTFADADKGTQRLIGANL
ncbi:MAG: hypothetical protein ABL903_17785 [Methylococcales bacterium]